MDRTDVYQALHQFISVELLQGEAKDLDGQTPLLEWGLIDSFSLVKLVGFIDRQFGIRLSPLALNPATFQSLDTLTSFLCSPRPG